MSDEIYKERRRIAYRLCGFFIPRDEIAHATKIPIDEVNEIDRKRTTYYNKMLNERTNWVVDVDKEFAELGWDELEELYKKEEDKIEKALANAAASLELDGLLITPKGEDLVRKRLRSEITLEEFFVRAKKLAKEGEK